MKEWTREQIDEWMNEQMSKHLPRIYDVHKVFNCSILIRRQVIKLFPLSTSQSYIEFIKAYVILSFLYIQIQNVRLGNFYNILTENNSSWFYILSGKIVNPSHCRFHVFNLRRSGLSEMTMLIGVNWAVYSCCVSVDWLEALLWKINMQCF